MKSKLFIVMFVTALSVVLYAGCGGSGGESPPVEVKQPDNPVIIAPGDTSSGSTTEIDVSDDEGASEDIPETQGQAETPAETSDSAFDKIQDIINSYDNKPSAEPDKEQESSSFAVDTEPPILLSAEYFGSGIDAKFSLSVIIPAEAFEFQGSYHGSGAVELEAAYRDVGGIWLDWDEQKVDLWKIDQTTQALSFLYPAENMIPRTEFRVRLTYRYTDDSGEHSASSAWSATADTMPGELPTDDSEAFVGQWHTMNMLAAGWDERYAFHADGTFIYAASQINIETTIIYIFGTWSVYNGGLARFDESILSMEGARIVHDDSFGDHFEGGKPVMTVIDYPERSMCGIERGGVDPESGRRTISINGTTWYNFDENDEFTSFFSEYEYYMGDVNPV